MRSKSEISAIRLCSRLLTLSSYAVKRLKLQPSSSNAWQPWQLNKEIPDPTGLNSYMFLQRKSILNRIRHHRVMYWFHYRKPTFPVTGTCGFAHAGCDFRFRAVALNFDSAFATLRVVPSQGNSARIVTPVFQLTGATPTAEPFQPPPPPEQTLVWKAAR